MQTVRELINEAWDKVYVLTPGKDKKCWSGGSVKMSKEELLERYGECLAELNTYEEDDGFYEGKPTIRQTKNLSIYYEGVQNE